ncbi:recombinase family protein [Pseudomonas fluorescens]|uniref:Serine recombinase n=1 Tax=Pseudomonas fluorescens TaxID=294 RepID=A0A0F4SYE6_PSEFL|nr:recombinase family protein [Pseudomonas fluorescens]KJZ37203.1 serine recombinase [Pseudomonas fluorescens]
MDVVAYLRVSTGKQERSGLGLEAQREYIHKAASQEGWDIVGEYIDAVSGSVPPLERPECAKALQRGVPLVVAKLDRLSRDVEHIAGLMKQAPFKVATMPQADAFQLHLYAALAQQERTFIRARIKDALDALQHRADSGDVASQEKIARRSEALAKGSKAPTATKMMEAKAQMVEQHREAIRPHIKACLYDGVNTLQGVADCLNKKGQKTSRGGEWNPTTVRRLMISLGLSFS